MDAIAEKLILAVLLPIELTNGNEGRSKKWFRSSQLREDYEMQFVMDRITRQPFAFRVIVHVTRVLGHNQSLWDSSSIGRGNYKEIEDALVAVGWFKNDSPKWIRETRFFQDASRRDIGPKTQIEVFKDER